MRFFQSPSLFLDFFDEGFSIQSQSQSSTAEQTTVLFCELQDVNLQQGLLFDDFVINTQTFQTRIQGIRHTQALEFFEAIRGACHQWLIGKAVKVSMGGETLEDVIEKLFSQNIYLSQSAIRDFLQKYSELGQVLSHIFFDDTLIENSEFTSKTGIDSKSLDVFLSLYDPNSEKVKQHNDAFVQAEIDRVKPWLAHLEAYPLTDEQLTAVVTEEDRNLLIASAGSGKSSTLVAKVVYLLKNELAQPNEIALLAYNDEASQSIRNRLMNVLGDAIAQQIQISTFHAFGLNVIFEKQGFKPRIVDFAQGGNRALIEFFDATIRQKLAEDDVFKQDWFEYLALYKKPRPPLFSIDSMHKYYDYLLQIGATYHQSKVGRKTVRRPVFECLNGLLVTSLEAQMIANWLILHQIEFQYLKPVELPGDQKALPADFYYPTIGVYHDHFAINTEGYRPVFLENYDDFLTRKQNIVKTYDIAHFVTTSADFESGEIFNKLDNFFIDKGLEPKWMPLEAIEPKLYANYSPFDDLTIFCSFLQHFKANGASLADLDAKIEWVASSIHSGLFPAESSAAEMDKEPLEQTEFNPVADFDLLRTNAFLKMFKPLYAAYQENLNQQNAIDFNDQINQACLVLESREWRHQFKYLLVDEFQDISQDRKRLLKALLDQKPECRLFAVGDDWQSIYRFSGADIDIMTHFERHFGVTKTNYLTRTFRCYQGIADVAANFVQRNPEQLTKTVQAHANIQADQVHIEAYSSQSEHNEKLLALLDKLNALAYKHQQVLSVYLLARYHRLKPNNLSYLQQRCLGLKIDFKTIHASKGLEADYVIMLNLESGTYGFPSTLSDDAILNLVIPKIEHFEHAEERRLFYVALTRAKRGVFLLSSSVDTSSFVADIIEMEGVKSSDSLRKLDQCPKCGEGKMLERYGQYGIFWGCNLYPACDHTEKCFCPECDVGTLVAKESEHGKFYGCSTYPECDYIHERGKQKLKYYSAATSPAGRQFKRIK